MNIVRKAKNTKITIPHSFEKSNIQSDSSIDRFENRLDELNVTALISTLIFGFSVSLWIDFDEALFANDIILAIIYTISALATIICSALATSISICSIVGYRRLIFKFYDESSKITDKHVLQFKGKLHLFHKYMRLCVYLSYIGLFAALCAYSHVKWQSIHFSLYVISYTMLVCGIISIIYVYRRIRTIFSEIKRN